MCVCQTVTVSVHMSVPDYVSVPANQHIILSETVCISAKLGVWMFIYVHACIKKSLRQCTVSVYMCQNITKSEYCQCVHVSKHR